MNPKILELAKTTSALDAIRKDLIRCGFELEFHAVDGLSNAEQCDEKHQDIRDLIDGDDIEVGEDQSVRGGEIRTIGGLKPTRFMAAATALFSTHDFEIDTGCSFHIHLSVPGVRHSYGKVLQAEMMAYILDNQHRIPKPVVERLKSKALRFCQFKLDSDKMRAVHGHSQRTWEFRLFGNVTHELDAWRCLLLAIDTLRHAYAVRAGMKPPLVSMELGMTFADLAKAAIENGWSLRKQERFDRLRRQQTQTA